VAADNEELNKFNESQQAAIRSMNSPLSLIWGPPGTGKTTVVVQILRRLVRNLKEGSKILMAASTHNAVDNVLERFIATNILPASQIIRAATDANKVGKALQGYTIDARLGGSPTDNPRLIKQAEKRVQDAVIVFTTCTGAGLGVLRKVEFDYVLVDEASQITEAGALIPLVKGCKRAVLVGDHVQLRPTVKPLGKVFNFDVSLLERLYTGPEQAGLSRTMLDVQYRFPEELARFPSDHFYQGKLRTGTEFRPDVERTLRSMQFAWPSGRDGHIIANVFVECAAEEDYGRSSKANAGQAELIKYIVENELKRKALSKEGGDEGKGEGEGDTSAADELISLEITVLTPYTRQVRELRQRLPSSIIVSTVDSFQGRESDIIVFSTVRCNANEDIGFLDDARRLNVAWTRAKCARIVVGHRATLEKNSELWRAAVADCVSVSVTLPAGGDT